MWKIHGPILQYPFISDSVLVCYFCQLLAKLYRSLYFTECNSKTWVRAREYWNIYRGPGFLAIVRFGYSSPLSSKRSSMNLLGRGQLKGPWKSLYVLFLDATYLYTARNWGGIFCLYMQMYLIWGPSTWAPPLLFSISTSMFRNTVHWLLLVRRKLPLLIGFTRDTRNKDREKSSVAEFINPWLGDKVNSGIGLSYRYDRLHSWRACTTTLCRSWLYLPVRDLWIRLQVRPTCTCLISIHEGKVVPKNIFIFIGWLLRTIFSFIRNARWKHYFLFK